LATDEDRLELPDLDERHQGEFVWIHRLGFRLPGH
jgi:hypothetical protein